MIGRVQRATRTQKIIIYLVLGSLSLVMIYPFVFMLATSLKDTPEVFSNIMGLFGERLRFDNYQTVVDAVNMGKYMLNGGMPRFVNYPEGARQKITGSPIQPKPKEVIVMPTCVAERNSSR